MQALGILFIVVGISIFVSAKSAIHEIEAFIVLLIATVLICSGSLRDVLTKMRHDILDRLPERKASSPLFIHPIQTSNSAAHWESRNRSTIAPSSNALLFQGSGHFSCIGLASGKPTIRI